MNYPLLKFGDNLPMVGVVQVLLNRTGTKLTCDGAFGPKTFAAVKAFQASHRLVQDGVVGEHTWKRLSTGANLPILDAVDIFDPTFDQQDATDIRRAGGNPLVVGGMCNGVEQVVSLIVAQSHNLCLLRLHGHGRPGGMNASAGHTPGGREFSEFNAAPAILAIMHRLSGVFGPYGSVEFISCETGRGHAGKSNLQKISASLGVPVTGAVNDQPFSRAASFRLEGPVVTACPGGQPLKNWCSTLPPMAGMSVA